MQQLSGDHRENWALGAFGAVIVITVGWWVAALWPLPSTTPEWVVRARAACFGSTETGLPDSGGWILLIGTPLTMLAALQIMAGRELRNALQRLRGSTPGRTSIWGVAFVLIVLSGAAGTRVSNLYGFGGAREGNTSSFAGEGELIRSSQPAPELRLTDQSGTAIDLSSFRGRPVIVTFAFGKCETVCPLIVHEASRALEATREMESALLVVTLDPWRDTPVGLARIAESWDFGADAHLLGGAIDEVEKTLDAWQIERRRDLKTGDVAHPAIAYVIDQEGRIAFTLAGGARIEEAIRKLYPTAST